MGTLDVVAKGEEGIATQCHALVLGEPLTALFCGERLWLLGEEHLPSAVAQHVFPLVRDIHVDGVVAVGATYAWLEGERHYLGALPHPPCVGLAASQTGAVDTALLSGADTDGLSVLDIAYRVALGIFEGDEGDDQVTASLIGEGLVLGRDVLKESGVVEAYLVASLLEGDTKDLLALDGRGLVVGVYLYHVVGTLALVAEHGESLVGITRSYHTVAYLALDEQGSSLVTHIAQRHKVAIRTHTVGTARTGIGTREGRQLEVYVIDKVDVAQRVGQGQTDGSTGRAHVLERRCGGQACGSLEFAHQLPGVESVKEIDVAGTAVDNLEGQFAFLHKDTGRLLVRITSVLKCKFFHLVSIIYFRVQNYEKKITPRG